MQRRGIARSLVVGAVALAGTGAASAGDCAPIAGLDALLVPGRVLLLGELHGTVESPAFVLDVACRAAARQLPVVVALELPSIEQERVDRFLDSDGTAADRDKLLVGAIWQASYQDGRASQAMLALVGGVRRLRREGHAARIVLFDPGTRGGNQVRDRAMGERVASAALAAPRSVTIVLTGNLHSRTTKGRRGNAEYEPLGRVVAQRVAAERLVALDVAHAGGSAWICTPDCGITALGRRQAGQPWTIEIDAATRPAGHDGWYSVGTLTASPPATSDLLAELPQSLAEEPAVEEAGEAGEAEEVGEVGEPGEAEPTTAVAPTGPLSAAERRIQGTWQAHDYASDAKTWTMDFDGRAFLADGGPDDWYEGRIAIRDDVTPGWIDFTIDDCRCAYKGRTSTAIYRWDGDALVIAAPTPGRPRPSTFVPSRGDMLRLRRRAPDAAESAGDRR